MSNDKRVVSGKMDVGGLAAPIWLIGWLFTVGYAHLPLSRAVLALVLWPYYLGIAVGR